MNNNNKLFPQYSFNGLDDEYIFITSLNLGGAEKIVTDHLWANHWNKRPIQYTLIVLYEKEKEHLVPPSVNIIRLHSKIEAGEHIFKQLAFRNKSLVCHLINDNMLNYLFNLNVNVNLVIHNDQQGWVNKPYIFNHSNIGSLIGVCHYVSNQIKQYTDKPIITLRHQIQLKEFEFNSSIREQFRQEFNFSSEDKVIGMLGRIAWQKNYPKAIETLFHLVQKNTNWKLMIIGGYAPNHEDQYIYLLKLINHYNLNKHVVLTGFRNDVKKLINTFDYSLNTSHFEGLSMATQELIGNGLDVFCVNTCGQNEIFDLKKQIHFYKASSTPEDLAKLLLDFDSTNTKIRNHEYTDDEFHTIAKQSWASHRVWNLLHHSGYKQENNNNFAFLTSNLNLGGAQKSLTNLVVELKSNNINAPIIIANQSNQLNLLQELIEKECEVFLASDSIDAFDITNSILQYCKTNKISKILFWNVDSKLRLLITKIAQSWLEVIDVSPGHYCFDEMETEQKFMNGIYFNSKQYHEKINKFIFKYSVDDSHIPFLDVLKPKTSIIPNGVFLKEKTNISINDLSINNKIINFKENNPNSYHFVVCGRIAQSKHLEIIFEAFLLSNNTNVYLHIIGTHEDRDQSYFDFLSKKYSEHYGKNIIFYGNCDESQHVLSNFDCLIVLGTHQGCPNITLESFASNIAIIANDSGGTKEIVNDITGIILPETPNIELLKDAINYTVKNKETMKKKSELGNYLIKSKFSMEAMKNNYLKTIFD